MVRVSQVKVTITAVGRFFPAKMPNGFWAEDFTDMQYASILLMDVDGTRILWVSLDAIGCTERFSQSAREILAAIIKEPIENVNIGYTHSHCAPRVGSGDDPAFDSYVADQLCDGLQRCLKQGFEEVRVFERNFDGAGYYSNRNGLEKIGDTGIKLLEFRNDEGETKGLILSYACHSTVVNFQNTREITSDLGGYLARGLEERYGIYPVVMVGAAGDMSNRCIRQGNTYDELVRIGDGLLSRMDIDDGETELLLQNPSVTPYQYKKTFVTTREQRQAQITNIKQQIAEATTADLKRVFSSALEHAEREPDGTNYVMDIKGAVFRLGDLEVVTMPAELFSCFGLQIKKAMPVKCPVFWGYSNYSVGYLYNIEEAGKSFESAATDIPAGIPEDITRYVSEAVK